MEKGVNKSWGLVFLGMFVIFAGSLAAVLPGIRNLPYLAMLLGELLLGVPVYVGIRQLRLAGIQPDFGKLRFSPVLILPLFLLPICMQQFCSLLMSPFLQGLTEWMGEQPDSVSAADSVLTFFKQVAVVCIAAPVMEELFCRGLLVQLVRPYGMAAMIFVPAAGFALMHFDIRQIPVIFMLGILLSVVRVMTGSIGAAIFVHASNNFLTLILLFAEESLPDAAVGAIAVSGMVLFPVLLFVYLRLMRTRSVPVREVRREKMRLTPMAVVCAGAVVLYNALLIFETWF